MKNVDNLKLWCLFRQRLSLQGEQNIVSAIDNALGKLGLVINSDNEIVSDEEQGEKPIIEMKTPEESLGIDSDTYNKIVDECVYELEEQKPAWSEEDERMYRGLHNLIYSTPYCDSRKELSDWLESLQNRCLPQLKQEWSEDDELHIKELESLVKQVWAIAEHENHKDTIHKMSDLSFFLKTLKPQPKQEWGDEDKIIADAINKLIKDVESENGWNCIYNKDGLEIKFNSIRNWLKSIRGRSFYYNKQEWSEEDAKALNRISAILVGASEVKNWWKEYRLIERDEMIRLTDFLKSLRPQSRWKPSGEQMEILDMVLTNESMDDNIARILRELREQLKKLKEE